MEKRLTLLRNLMADNKIDTYIITKLDPHQSEYAHPSYNEVYFISGFTGSNGNCVITKEEAGLWTDSRYFIQASNEMESEFTLHKEGIKNTIDFLNYAVNITPPSGTIAFCGKSLSVSQVRSLISSIARNNQNIQHKIQIKSNVNLINKIWPDRPTFLRSKIFTYDISYTGQFVINKINIIRKEMTKNKSQLYVISSLDDIAWLLNIRCIGTYSSFNFLAYLVVTQNEAILFIDTIKEDEQAIKNLGDQNIKVLPYNEVYNYLQTSSYDISMFAPKRNSYTLYSKMANKKLIELQNDITSILKSQKNEIEIKNTKIANEKEGANFVRLIKWLKETVTNTLLTEYDVTQKIKEIRKNTDTYLDESFEAIVAYGPNGAIPHYKVKKETALIIKNSGSILIDTGANYLEGTTDITRTLLLGDITSSYARNYTACLKGNIALDTLIFIYGTLGTHIDAIAKAPLWQQGLHYGHGTGHGIGHLLNVHEGPCNISSKVINTQLEEGMLLSNEPGVYIESEYGIRLETSLFVKKAFKNEQGQFMKFENVVLVPFDNKSILKEMLTPYEINWLNTYHAKVYETLKKHLNEDERKWLHKVTQAI